MIKVPCNGCTRCCWGDAVRILPHENREDWQTEPHFLIKGARMLKHRPDKSCVYLGEGGCTIYDRRPQICGELDCRIFADISFTKARQLHRQGKLNMGVWRKGKELKRKTP